MTAASGIVLAGGRSSRMGTPKALLRFDDRPLVEHIVGTLRSLFDDVVVVAAPGQELPALAATIVHDEIAYQGPVSGICNGLRAAGGELGFVTSCDSVFLDRALIADLVGRAPGYDVVVPRWNDRFQPLHAVYRASVLPVLEAQLARGEMRPVDLFPRVRTLTVPEEDVRSIDPQGDSFYNMNTPEEYAEALVRWERRRAAMPPEPGTIACTVELLGAARLAARTRTVPLTLPAGATFAELFRVLADRLPALARTVIDVEHGALVTGYACDVNGVAFVRTPHTRVQHGDSIAILSADAGG